MTKYLFLFLALTALISGCRKDRIYTRTIEEEDDPTIKVTSSVFGMLTDGSGNTKSNVAVNINNYQVSSDEDGFFMFKDIIMKEKGVTLETKVPGYFTSYKVISPKQNRTASVLISLLQKKKQLMFNGDEKATLESADGASAIIPKNAVFTKYGERHTGSILGSIQWVNPTDKNFIDVMPGHMIGEDKIGLNKILTTYGMLVVELLSENGQMLFLDQNEVVELHYPVPKNMLNNAPTDIPLWYFDAVKGRWIEEGTAVLENGFYVGNVNHLGYWSCNATREMTQVKAQIKFENSASAANLEVRVMQTINGTKRDVFSSSTDNTGYVVTQVPTDEILQFEVYSSCDGQLVHSMEIGPFPKGSIGVLEEIIIPEKLAKNYTLTGMLYDCNLNPIKNGYVKAVGQVFPTGTATNNDGKFVIEGVACNNDEITFKVYDLDNRKSDMMRRIPLREFAETGNIVLCSQKDISMQLDYLGRTYDFINFAGLSGDNIKVFERFAMTENDSLDFLLTITQYKGVGAYPIEGPNVEFFINFDKPAGEKKTIKFIDPSSVTVNITTDDGLWIEGYISADAYREVRKTGDKFDQGSMKLIFKLPRFIE